MAELVTVARPYAEALFRAAAQGGELAAVADGVSLAAVIAADGDMRRVMADPRVPAAQKEALFFSVAGDKLPGLVKKLVTLLLEGRRETLLPAIASVFGDLKREHDSVLRARITSARPLDDAQRSQIVLALERQYGRKVEAEVDVDPELLGGARVQLGDQVINASVKDALAQMASALAR